MRGPARSTVAATWLLGPLGAALLALAACTAGPADDGTPPDPGGPAVVLRLAVTGGPTPVPPLATLPDLAVGADGSVLVRRGDRLVGPAGTGRDEAERLVAAARALRAPDPADRRPAATLGRWRDGRWVHRAVDGAAAADLVAGVEAGAPGATPAADAVVVLAVSGGSDGTPVREWPLGDPEGGVPVDGAACRVLRGADAETALAATPGGTATVRTEGGTALVAVRPLLPWEGSCGDLT